MFVSQIGRGCSVMWPPSQRGQLFRRCVFINERPTIWQLWNITLSPLSVSPPDQPLSPERSEDSRAAEVMTSLFFPLWSSGVSRSVTWRNVSSLCLQMQRVGSLKVTIQRSSESREFGQTDRTAEGQTGGLHCHVCDHACRSVQVGDVECPLANISSRGLGGADEPFKSQSLSV